jgi:hypothetical protein
MVTLPSSCAAELPLEAAQGGVVLEFQECLVDFAQTLFGRHALPFGLSFLLFLLHVLSSVCVIPHAVLLDLDKHLTRRRLLPSSCFTDHCQVFGVLCL